MQEYARMVWFDISFIDHQKRTQLELGNEERCKAKLMGARLDGTKRAKRGQFF